MLIELKFKLFTFSQSYKTDITCTYSISTYTGYMYMYVCIVVTHCRVEVFLEVIADLRAPFNTTADSTLNTTALLSQTVSHLEPKEDTATLLRLVVQDTCVHARIVNIQLIKKP